MREVKKSMDIRKNYLAFDEVVFSIETDVFKHECKNFNKKYRSTVDFGGRGVKKNMLFLPRKEN